MVNKLFVKVDDREIGRELRECVRKYSVFGVCVCVCVCVCVYKVERDRERLVQKHTVVHKKIEAQNIENET